MLGLALASCSSQSATPSSTSSTTASTTSQPPATTTSTVDSNRQILNPATTPPKVDECSVQLSYGADGSYGPLTCANGTEVNVIAWNAAISSSPAVLALGPTASPSEVEAAICSDMAHSTIPIEQGAYQLAALYNGWSFGYDPSQGLVSNSNMCG